MIENVPEGSTNCPLVLCRLSFFDLLEEKDKLAECAKQVARTWVVA